MAVSIITGQTTTQGITSSQRVVDMADGLSLITSIGYTIAIESKISSTM